MGGQWSTVNFSRLIFQSSFSEVLDFEVVCEFSVLYLAAVSDNLSAHLESAVHCSVELEFMGSSVLKFHTLLPESCLPLW